MLRRVQETWGDLLPLRLQWTTEKKKNDGNFWQKPLSQRFADQSRIILKKGWFSEFEILEICGLVSREEYEQGPHT